MNARQKAKKLKIELERIKKFPIPTVIYNPNSLMHKRVKCKIDDNYYQYIPKDKISEYVAKDIADKLLPIIEARLIIDNDGCFMFDCWV